MAAQTQIVRPGPRPRTMLGEKGEIIDFPEGWEVLPPGDAGLTRRVKAAGPTFTMEEKVGRKRFSRGVVAPAETIANARAVLEEEREDPAYARKLAAGRARRDKEQAAYVEDFRGAVLDYLGFAPQYAALASNLAEAVTAHATPVGSGTVARTERIPVEERAEAAVIAWMRHQTTAYDDMKIARIKGERRRVRRMLAERSKSLLDGYRHGRPPAPEHCPLLAALSI